MTLPYGVEELLDVFRRRVLDQELSEITRLIESGISGSDLEWMQTLEGKILKVYHMEGPEGYDERQMMCVEIARAKHGESQSKVS